MPSAEATLAQDVDGSGEPRVAQVVAVRGGWFGDHTFASRSRIERAAPYCCPSEIIDIRRVRCETKSRRPSGRLREKRADLVQQARNRTRAQARIAVQLSTTSNKEKVEWPCVSHRLPS